MLAAWVFFPESGQKKKVLTVKCDLGGSDFATSSLFQGYLGGGQQCQILMRNSGK